MPRIDTRQYDPLRAAREGRAARGDDKQFYDEYGFAMTPDEYKTFNEEVTKQNEAFASQRTNMMGAYEELSAGNEYDLGELWEDTDKLTIHVPYKGRVGSLGEIPKSSYKDFVNAIQTSPHLGKRTSVSAPLAEDVPGYIEKLYESKEVFDAGIADYNRAKEAAQDAFTAEHIDEDRDAFMYEAPIFEFNREIPGAKELEEARQIKLDAGYRQQTRLGPGNWQLEHGGADALIKNYEDLNIRGDLSFMVSDRDYYRALYYEMPNITAGVKGQWDTAVSQQYKESQALLDTELEDAELTLQGYVDEFQTGIGSFAEEYQRDQAAREEAFSGMTIG